MDKYDKAIAYLTAKPTEIASAWSYPTTHEAGCLFEYVNEDCGCLTQIRLDPDMFGDKSDLVIQASKDERIPMNMELITVESLPVFAEYQRKFDKMNTL
jgi:hypothetical protein